MPTQEEFEETYWTICRLGGWFPYPCQKTRILTRWCYQFDWLVEYGFGVFSIMKACESGVRYEWRGSSFFIFGRRVLHNVKLCYRRKRPEKGTCNPFEVPD